MIVLASSLAYGLRHGRAESEKQYCSYIWSMHTMRYEVFRKGRLQFDAGDCVLLDPVCSVTKE